MNDDLLKQQEKALFVGLLLALVACVPAVAVALNSGSDAVAQRPS